MQITLPQSHYTVSVLTSDITGTEFWDHDNGPFYDMESLKKFIQDVRDAEDDEEFQIEIRVLQWNPIEVRLD